MGPDLKTPSSPTASREHPELAALELVSLIGWQQADNVVMPEGVDPALAKALPPEKAAPLGRIIAHGRQPIKGNIVHYSFQVQTGPGRYDVIGVHRVVKEVRPNQPIDTHKQIFLQHGDWKNFPTMFMPGRFAPSQPDDFGFAIYLAENDVDVWGIDQAWSIVPDDVSDFGFMADWGLQRHIDDLGYALSIARFIRLFTGSGYDQMILLGYSSGVLTGYSLLSQETTLRPFMRNVSAFIPVDVPYKTDLQVLKDTFTAEFNRTKAMLDNGEYGDLIPLKLLADWARTDPDGDSPIFAGMTNMQTALYMAAGPIFGPIPTHYFGGIWENDMPVDLRYVTIDECFDFMAASPMWEATKFINDYCKILAELEDVPWDDHLGRIKVPILNVSAGGGFYEMTYYTTSLLGSSDITHLMPQLLSADEALFDFAHIDIFISQQAQNLIWEPMLRWIEAHTSVFAAN